MDLEKIGYLIARIEQASDIHPEPTITARDFVNSIIGKIHGGHLTEVFDALTQLTSFPSASTTRLIRDGILKPIHTALQDQIAKVFSQNTAAVTRDIQLCERLHKYLVAIQVPDAENIVAAHYLTLKNLGGLTPVNFLLQFLDVFTVLSTVFPSQRPFLYGFFISHYSLSRETFSSTELSILRQLGFDPDQLPLTRS